MVRVEDAIVARYTEAGKIFELLVDPDLALKVKNGEQVNMDNLLAIDTVFKDAKKGFNASPAEINSVFGTQEIAEVAKIIITKGDVSLTTKQKKEILEEKRKAVIYEISKRAFNPQTKAPHPPLRIENAINEAKVHIDINKGVEEQVTEIVEKLKPLIPISIETIYVKIEIPSKYAGKAQAVLRKYEMSGETWNANGSLSIKIKLPAGMQNDLYNDVNNFTKGEATTEIVKN